MALLGLQKWYMDPSLFPVGGTIDSIERQNSALSPTKIGEGAKLNKKIFLGNVRSATHLHDRFPILRNSFYSKEYSNCWARDACRSWGRHENDTRPPGEPPFATAIHWQEKVLISLSRTSSRLTFPREIRLSRGTFEGYRDSQCFRASLYETGSDE